MHIHFDYHTHIVSSLLHDPFDNQSHKPHAVVKAASELIMAMIGIRRKELADKISVSGMYFHTVKSGFTRKIHRISKIIHQRVNLITAQRPYESRRIKIESGRRTHRHTPASGTVGHIAAMPKLDGRLGPVRMDRIGKFLKFRDNLLPHPQLPVKGQPGPAHGSISHCSHPYATARYSRMIVKQILGRPVAIRHVLKCGRSDNSVAKFHRSYPAGSKNSGFHKINK